MRKNEEAVVLNPRVFSGKFIRENKTLQVDRPQESSAFKNRFLQVILMNMIVEELLDSRSSKVQSDSLNNPNFNP